MPEYSFSFDPAASGLPYTITDRAGLTVDSGTLDSSDDVVTVTATLPFGYYQARAAAAGSVYASTPAYFATGEDVESSGGGGAAEAAYFVGTATTDTSGDPFPIVWVEDPEQDPVSWARVVDDDIEVDGPILVRVVARQGGVLDMSGATGFSTDNQPTLIEGFIKANPDGNGANNCALIDDKIPVGTPGDTFDIDAPSNVHTDAAANGQMIITGTNDVLAYDEEGGPVTDGVFSSIVRIMVIKQAIPDLPTL